MSKELLRGTLANMRVVLDGCLLGVGVAVCYTAWSAWRADEDLPPIIEVLVTYGGAAIVAFVLLIPACFILALSSDTAKMHEEMREMGGPRSVEDILRELRDRIGEDRR